MPVAPTQVIEPIEYDKFQVYTIELKNRTSCQNNNLAGKFCILGLLWHTENSQKKLKMTPYLDCNLMKRYISVITIFYHSLSDFLWRGRRVSDTG